MKSIRILDKDINLLGEIDNYQEFKLTRKFFNLSTFEMKISANSLHVPKLVKNNLILLGKDYNKVCIILHREFDGIEGKTDTLVVKGVSLQGLINRRLIVPAAGTAYESCSGKQESIIKHFVNKNCINPINIKRKINRLAIAEDKLRGLDDSWRSSYDNLSDKIGEISEYAGLGWNVVLDKESKKFIFDVIQGKDLSINQNLNPPVIFRSDFNNIAKRHYIESIINSKNSIYVGAKEDETKLVLNFGEVEDFERMEVFSSITSDDPVDLNQEGKVKLKEFEELKSFELEINPTKTFIYEKDYNLGDIVTIQDRSLKVTMDSRIVEVEEVHSKSGVKIKIVFGTSIPNILSKINKIERKVV